MYPPDQQPANHQPSYNQHLEFPMQLMRYQTSQQTVLQPPP